MCAVGELQAQRVLTRREFDRNCRLALAVVEVLLIGQDDFPGGDEVGIDKDVEMSGVPVDLTGRLDHQAGGRHHDLKRRGDGCPVQRIKEGDRLVGSIFLDEDDYRVAELLALQRGVGAVGELQMQHVLSGRQCQFRLERTIAEVEMLFISGDDLPAWDEIGIDEDVHVSRARVDIARRLNRHATCAHLHNKRWRHYRVTGRLAEEYVRLHSLFWRGRRLSLRGRACFRVRFGLCFFYFYFYFCLRPARGQRCFPFRITDRLQIRPELVHAGVDHIYQNQNAQNRAANSDQRVYSVH